MATDGELLSRLVRCSGLSREDVLRFVQLDLVVLADGALEARLVRRLRRARRLRRDLGLSVDAVAIVLRLLDRVEALEGSSGPPVARVLDDRPR
jgi:hypothetical protein